VGLDDDGATVGFRVGRRVGTRDGANVGLNVVGARVGVTVGIIDGKYVGLRTGAPVGVADGGLGAADGRYVGRLVFPVTVLIMYVKNVVKLSEPNPVVVDVLPCKKRMDEVRERAKNTHIPPTTYR